MTNEQLKELNDRIAGLERIAATQSIRIQELKLLIEQFTNPKNNC